ncbi:amidohydrolase family protein [Sphingobium boeckii]|uniref:Imidazolonepropionase-like amidohydrolase n=1 Tax=Sphingobium boeckii TaxID=1082345 RepID=A0A7W9AI14_9SPHN|nr:amidohydrolase family protein [Sphingobium boeckii]MBB5685980.1 imidazolonepropionase-like amidohydrolase [Sphingobium boeckii]
MNLRSRTSTLAMRGAAVVALMAWPALPLVAQRPMPDTTDDVRRVPVPPVDRSHQPIVVLKGGTLLEARDGRSLENAVVVMQGDRIVAAGPAASTPVPANAARVIDATGLFIMPGLIDLHIHFTQQRGTDMGRYSDSPAAAAIRGTALADQLVTAGITAVRDVGTMEDVALRIKEGVDRGIIRGPRVMWSGQLIASTGGHGDEVTSTATGRQKPALGGASHGVDGPWEWRMAVREQVRKLADWIKIGAPANKEELAAAIEEAHSLGVPVAIDSYGDYTDMAIEAGVDTLEHPLLMSDKAVPLMKKHGTSFVPTIGAFDNLLEGGYPTAGIPTGGFYHTHSRRFVINQQDHLKRVAEAHRAGVPIGVGTDIPFENEWRYPDAYFRELDYLRQAGLSNAEVLASATRVGAQIMRMGDKLGTIEPGKIADILVTGSDPRTDLKNLRDVRYVIADGAVVVGKEER